MDDRQLEWVQKNWAPRRDRAVPIGEVLRELVPRPGKASPDWKGRLLDVIEELTGPEFLAQAEPVSVRAGVLTLRVGEPAIAYHLRLQWEQRLIRHLAARLPQAGITTIRFSTATSR